jgi:tetratricopeptide (TPR) repeat protein
MTDDFDGARKQYERAARLYPAAQSPWLVLSQLAWRKGNLREAIAAMEKALTLQDVNDPWWEYLIAHVQDADSLLTEIRIEIGKLPR